MESDSEAALRRVAIVLSSLPDATVARLMMGLGGEQQRAVRTALSRLSDVDPLERRRVLEAFAASVRRGNAPPANENDAAEIVLSRAALQHHERQPEHRGPTVAAQTAPLAFLCAVDDDALAAEIGKEHPQTIAIILASLDPAQAARILQHLDVTTRQEMMRRLAKLDAPSPEVINDIGGQLKNKLLASGARFGASAAGRGGSGARGKVGQDALRAILAEMPRVHEHPLPAAMPVSASTAAFDSALASGAMVNSNPTQAARGNSQRDGHAEKSPSASESTEAIHARLVALPTERLRQALASVETRQSLLALCGLPSVTAEKVLASLPRRQARQVRRQLADLGAIELREIDRAKAAVATAADKIDQVPRGQAASAAARQGSLMAA